MSPKDWITMGNELRVELDALEKRLSVLVVDNFLPEDGPDANPCWKQADAILDVYVCVPIERVREWEQAFNKRSRTALRSEYRDGLVKLRSHGRAKDWPDEPWRVE